MKEIIKFGNFEGNPLEWRVLDKTDESMLLITKKPLMRKCYHDKEDYTSWKDCTLRKWLNDEFFSTSFSDEERSRILVSKLHNESNEGKWTSPGGIVVNCMGKGGEDTSDRIFLLSLSEFRKYYGEKCDDATVWWWLRTPGRRTYRAVTVSHTGELYIGGDYVDSGIFIRPVMRISII